MDSSEYATGVMVQRPVFRAHGLHPVIKAVSDRPRTFGSTLQVFWPLAIPVIQSLKSILPYISRC